MALKTKTDYFGLAASGWTIASTSENREVGTAEATSDDGFLVAVEAFGERLTPTCDYVATSNATLSSVVLGSVMTVDNDKKIALGSVSITTRAGEAPTMTASGSQIENNGTAHCTATLTGINVSHLFHAQDFGLFTVTGGQLIDSTLNIEGDIGIAEVDGVIKSSDLVGARITVSGTIVGVSNAGAISTPTVTLNTPTGRVLQGVFTSPLSETNPNGDFPQYTFTATWGLKADSNS